MCLLSTVCVAQNGVFVFSQDPRIDELVKKHRQIHENDSTIDGFRVQIFMESGNDALEHAEIMKAEFMDLYPSIPVHLVFGQPYYRLRVGDFRTRLEAENLHQQLQKDYKNAFVTADRIELPYIPLCAGEIDIESLFDTIDNRFLYEDERFIMDSLLFEGIINDTINYDFNEGFFYDE